MDQVTDQPAFLPDPETGRALPVELRVVPWRPRVWMTSAPACGMMTEDEIRERWPDLYICPRAYAPAVSLLEARAERRPFRWWLWLAMALPVVVAVVWRGM